MENQFLQLEEDIDVDDPSFRPLQGELDASPEEEEAAARAMAHIMDFLYSEEGMASVVQVMNQDSRQLYEIVPDIGAMLIQKAQSDLIADGLEPSAEIYFAEGGLLQQVPVMLFELAEQLGKPGAEDEDQLAAATIGLYKKAGDHVLKGKDQAAIEEAVSMGQDVVLAKEDGTREDPEKFAKRARAEEEGEISEKRLPAAVKKGLLGV